MKKVIVDTAVHNLLIGRKEGDKEVSRTLFVYRNRDETDVYRYKMPTALISSKVG